ncbi:ECF transporter S component [Oceanobacillus chungangensis]|uniref:ECF transporter S component n=1 Tax=Oceanobacillus chungangensis TaxID=1229152 RepID=A0A3D8PK84_9BACI|nr:ECF transporter S component [Oceanobacillus chungangensis]RDW15648.1 ECF transporter S component [Oceanobacillus chungangensis]
MKSKGIWSLNFSTIVIALIPIAVAINYLGKVIIETLKLPLWLDSIGTVISSMLAGPLIGAFTGLINNIIYGFTLSPISFVYAITSVVIGLGVGVMAHKGWIASISKAIVIGLVVGLLAAIVSTPLNIMFWEGTTGNVWGDAFYLYLESIGMPQWVASFGDSVVVDVPDKVITVVIGYLIYQSLPKNLIRLFNNNNEIEKL